MAYPAGEIQRDYFRILMKVKYNAANIGDILKHSWLIEVAEFLGKQHPSGLFKYADTFCGFKEYAIEDFFKGRLINQFQKTKLYGIQKNYLERNRYLGSAGIVRKLLGDRVKIDIFDITPAAVESFTGEEVTVIPLKSGYDVLESNMDYDLIFLDPYDDFWGVYEEVIEKVGMKKEDASVVLFLPFTEQNPYRDLIETIEKNGIRYIHGIAETRKPEMDGKWNAAMFFFPETKISNEEILIIENKLKALTDAFYL
jgi:23S rRNA A2030 N6-methylase RlmJ